MKQLHIRQWLTKWCYCNCV